MQWGGNHITVKCFWMYTFLCPCGKLCDSSQLNATNTDWIALWGIEICLDQFFFFKKKNKTKQEKKKHYFSGRSLITVNPSINYYHLKWKETNIFFLANSQVQKKKNVNSQTNTHTHTIKIYKTNFLITISMLKVEWFKSRFDIC